MDLSFNEDLFENLTDSSVNEQILKYEHCVDVVLRGDLKRVSKQYEQTCQDIVDHLNVKSSINSIKENVLHSFKSMIDIGSNCYAKAVV